MFSDDLLTTLAGRFDTPLYVLDVAEVRRRVADMQTAFPGASLRFAVKANPDVAVLRHLNATGVGAEVISEGELARAVRAGMPGDAILLGGPGQAPGVRRLAREVNVGRVSLDGVEQWRAWQEDLPDATRFFVRVNPGLDPATHPHLATGAAYAKFGVAPSVAVELARDVAREGRFAGFHVHVGSMIPDATVHSDVLSLLDTLFDAVPEGREVNLGGGFAVPSFDLNDLAARVTPWAETRGLDVMLEPGRWLVADAGVLLTRVLWRKDAPEGVPGARTHWICDAGMAQLVRPALYGAVHPIRMVGEGSGTSVEGDVEGPLCENADRLARNVTLAAAAGDLLAVEQAGAYGAGMASNYASDLLPAEVLVDGDSVTLTRRRQTREDLHARDAG